MSKKLLKTNRSKKLSFGKQVEQAFQQTVAEEIEQHRLTGNPIFVLHNGKYEWIAPENIPPLQKRGKITQINFRVLKLKRVKQLLSRKKINRKIIAARKLNVRAKSFDL